MVDFKGWLTMNHHNDAQFFIALGTEWFTKGLSAFESYKVCFHTINKALDDSAFAGFEIAEE
jgi:hypothetical protein